MAVPRARFGGKPHPFRELPGVSQGRRALGRDGAGARVGGGGGARRGGGGGAPRGDGAWAARTRRAEKVPLGTYVMLDSSGSMDALAASGQSKWAAIVAALTTFLRDPSSAGLGVG